MRLKLIFCASVALASPALAQEDDPLAPLDPATATEQPAAPSQSTTTPEPVLPPPPPPKVIPKDWRGVFTAINQGDWEAARLGIDGLPNGPLKPYAKAELYTAKGSPKVELGPLLAVVTEAPELPQAAQLQRMVMLMPSTMQPITREGIPMVMPVDATPSHAAG